MPTIDTAARRGHKPITSSATHEAPFTQRKIAVYGDGAELAEMIDLHRRHVVQGFTTNPTLMRKSGVTDYVGFAKSVLEEIQDVPVSFEVFADGFAEMERQARIISSWGENVYVKVPVTDTKGVSSREIVERLSQDGVKLNVTALMSVEQVRDVVTMLDPGTSAIISVFAGRIADTGCEPMPIMTQSAQAVRRLPLAKLLWASPREVLNIYQAEACGCDIVTATKGLLDKLPYYGKDLSQLSRETVEMFFRDALRANYTL